MSHFAVIAVVPGNVPEDEVEAKVDELLAGYHEFECTGVDDQYVQNIDVTADARASYEKDKTRMLEHYDHTLLPDTDARFWRDPTDEERTAIANKRMFDDPLPGTPERYNRTGDTITVYELPEGYAEIEVPTSTVQSFEEYARDYHGYPIKRNGAFEPHPDHAIETGNDQLGKYGYVDVADDGTVTVINRTNPGAKWDWHVVGGRWSGHFTTNDGKSVDIVRKRDWALHDALAKATQRAEARYDAVAKAMSYFPAIQPFVEMREAMGVRERPADYDVSQGQWDPLGHVRDAYNAQPGVIAAKDVDDPYAEPDADERFRDNKIIGFFDSVEDYLIPREQFIAARAWGGVGSYAMVDSEGWHEKGKMGWFGMSSDEDADWPTKALEKVNDLSGDTWLVCVDCHV